MRNQKPTLVPEEEQIERLSATREVNAHPNRPDAYYIETYGCQMNEHDSETIAGMLSEMGIARAETKNEAGIIVINTCCIRDNAERKALGNMTWLKQLKRKRPELILCVCGCMVQQPKMAQTILSQYPFFDIAFGTHALHRFPSLLLAALNEKKQVLTQDARNLIAENMPIIRTHPHKAYLSIMYGCDNFCSYCVVPYVRGRERSRAPDAILREAEALLTDGVQEITLLGQNVNSYGNDLNQGDQSDQNISFPALLRALDAMGVPRIRFMTSHPKDLSDHLIDVIANAQHVAKHIHLPVQSGSDRILFTMNRKYTRDQYLERVRALREAVPEIALTTDCIVGFPGETEADFLDTLSLVEKLRFDSAFTFIFSPREGTKAETLPERVDEQTAKDRIGRLIAAQEKTTDEVLNGLIGSKQVVLVDDFSRRNANEVTGKCERNITANFPGDESLIGKFIPVEIIEAKHNTLKARMIRSHTTKGGDAACP